MWKKINKKIIKSKDIFPVCEFLFHLKVVKSDDDFNVIYLYSFESISHMFDEADKLRIFNVLSMFEIIKF